MELQKFIFDDDYSISIVSDNLFFKNKISLTLNIGDDCRVQLNKYAALALLESYPIIKNHFKKMMFVGCVRMPIYADNDVSINVQLTKNKPAKGETSISQWDLVIYSTSSDPSPLLCNKYYSKEKSIRLYSRFDPISEAIDYWETAYEIFMNKAENWWRGIEQVNTNDGDNCKAALDGLMISDVFINEDVLTNQPETLQELIKEWIREIYKLYLADSSYMDENNDDNDSYITYEDSEDEYEEDPFNLYISGC